MTTYAGAADVIPGDLDGVDRATGTISTAADSAESRSAELRTAVDSTEDFWASPSGTAYRVAAQKQIGTTGMLVGPLDTASQAFGTLARELRGARSTVDRALADSVALGMGTSDLVGNPWAVTSFLLANPSTRRRSRACSVTSQGLGSLPARRTRRSSLHSPALGTD